MAASESVPGTAEAHYRKAIAAAIIILVIVWRTRETAFSPLP